MSAQSMRFIDIAMNVGWENHPTLACHLAAITYAPILAKVHKIAELLWLLESYILLVERVKKHRKVDLDRRVHRYDI